MAGKGIRAPPALPGGGPARTWHHSPVADLPAPRPAVAAVVRRDDGRWLVVKRAPHIPAGGYWTPVTGRPEGDEPLADAAARELREETGLVGRAVRELHVGTTDDGRWELHYFEMRLDDSRSAWGELVLAADELAEAAWRTADEIARLEPMFGGTRRFFAGVAGR